MNKVPIILLLFSSLVVAQEANYSTAIFAGGCFWCMESPYDKLSGVIKTEVGYTGGTLKNPTYIEVASGRTKHREVVKITYDPSVISYDKLLEVFWKNIDPTDSGGQFCDRGYQYTTAIFAKDETQSKAAQKSKNDLINAGKISNIVTPITSTNTFYLAENYHQDYYLKNPVRYKLYRYHCGRDSRLKQLWQ